MARFGSQAVQEPYQNSGGHPTIPYADPENPHHHHEPEPRGPDDVPFDRAASPNKRTRTMYYSDPKQMAIRVCALIALHDDLKVSEIKLAHTWRDLGFSEMSKIELFIELENEFALALPDEDTEKFANVYDLFQYLSKSPFLH